MPPNEPSSLPPMHGSTKSLVARAHTDPLAWIEERVIQVEVELRLAMAEATLLELEAERGRLDAELVEVRSERDAWKVLATWLLLAPKQSWWSFLVKSR